MTSYTRSTICPYLYLLLGLSAIVSAVGDQQQLAFHLPSISSRTVSRSTCVAATPDGDQQDNEKKKKKKKKKGYQFGDLSTGLMRRFTNNREYQFGDISRTLDQAAKDTVASLSNKEAYEFGDLSRYVDAQVKQQVNQFTGEDAYQFGDISKKILYKVRTGNYDLSDMVILFKILLAFGAGMSPMASLLPAKFLLELLDYSIVGDVSNKLIAGLTTELDRRMKQSVTGDPDYALGDLTKKAVLQYIGKEEYTFGDISRAVLDDNDGKQGGKTTVNATGMPAQAAKQGSILGNAENNDLLLQELELWDLQFIDEIPSTNATSTKP